MLDDILYKIDRASMASGLELREPMLDQDFVSLGLCIPDNLKLSATKSKACLRDLVDTHLPHVSRLPKRVLESPLICFTNQSLCRTPCQIYYLPIHHFGPF